MKNSISKAAFLLIISAFSLLSLTNSDEKVTQRIDRHVILFNINADLTFEQAQAIDANLSTKDGILASRTNPDNSIYFCYSLKSKDLTEADFKKWFAELGYEISCFDKIEEGKGVSKTFEELENCKK